MISESRICRIFSDRLPKGRVNDCFEADAEILPRLDGQMLFTTDEFSAEDLFREDDPYLLGWNIAAGALSDIFACGGKPAFYGHALTVDERWDEPFLSGFAEGVRGVLAATGTGFIGGDCGRSKVWRCTATVIGSCKGSPVLRRGARPGDAIYASGEIGAGNLEAAILLYGPKAGLPGAARMKLPLRVLESEVMSRFASSCIDTSDGLWSAVNSIAELNSVGYDLSAVRLCDDGRKFCRSRGLSELLLLLGECGEYELLFTVHPSREADFLAAAERAGCGFHKLGQITPSGRTLDYSGKRVNLDVPRPEARDYANPKAYLDALGAAFGDQLTLTQEPGEKSEGRI